MNDIVERLRKWPWPDCPLPSEAVADMQEAADTIERLRSICGKADAGQSFADIAKDMPRRWNEPADPKTLTLPDNV